MLEHICIILLVNFLFYFRTLYYQYVSDDIPVFHKPPLIKNLWHKLYLHFIGAYKWKPLYDHAQTMLIHAIVCVMIYLALGRNNVSFLAALLYTLNPANNQGSIWVSGRGYTLPLIGLLTSLAFPIIAPLGLLFCSWWTIGFLAPLVLIGSPAWKLVFFMPGIWLWHSRKFFTAVKNKQTGETFAEDKRMHPRKLILAIKTFGFYLVYCLFPVRVTFYHNLLQSCAGNKYMQKKAYRPDGYFWVGLLSGIAWIVYSCYRWDNIAYGFFWYAIAIAPFCNLIRANQEIADRFCYLPNVGLMFMLANIIAPYPYLAIAFLVFYATKMHSVMPMYKDDYFITEIAVIEDPKAWYAWHVRGMKRWDNQAYKEALILWVMAKLISPFEFKVLVNIATVLRLLKNDKEADAYLRVASEHIVEGQEKVANKILNDHKIGKFPIVL